MDVLSVVTRIVTDQYEAKVPHIRHGQPGREEYLRSRDEGEASFKRDALEAVGLKDHPKAEKAWELAWDMGHSSGFHEVLVTLNDLAKLVLD